MEVIAPRGNLATGPEEVICEGIDCEEATLGLYVAINKLADHDFTVDLLEKAFGVDSFDDPIQPGYHPQS